jgi:hypothetical protein
MRRREMESISMSDITSNVNNNKVMSTNKFLSADKVRIATEVMADQNGNEVTEVEKNMEFFVTQTYPENPDVYLVSNGEFKHKLLAKDLIKVK